MSTIFGRVGKGRCGSFHQRVNARYAGKTERSQTLPGEKRDPVPHPTLGASPEATP